MTGTFVCPEAVHNALFQIEAGVLAAVNTKDQIAASQGYAHITNATVAAGAVMAEKLGGTTP